MTVSFAILNRELVVASRRKRYFFMRAFYLGVLFLVVLWAWLAADLSAGTRFSWTPGGQMFEPFVWVQLFLVLAFAPPICSDLLSGERRRGTLSILLTTDQTSWRIVWNKVLSRFLYLELLILSSVAAMSVISFFGGVTWSQVLFAFVALSTTALQWCAIAIWLSSVFREGHASATLCYMLMVLGLALTPSWFRSGALYYWPLVSYYVAVKATVHHFSPGDNVVAHVLSALVVSALACLGAALSLRDDSSLRLTAPLSGVFGWLRDRFRRKAGKLAGERKPRPVKGDPIAWRESSTGVFGSRDRPWQAVIVYAAIVLGACLVWGNEAPLSGLLLALGAMLWASTTIMALQTSSACIAIEREKGTLGLVLALPITTDGILRGKLKGVYRHIRPRAATALVVTTIGLFSLSPLQILIGAAIVAIAVVALIYITMLGIYYSAKSRTQTTAFIKSLVATILYGAVFLVFLAVASAAFFVHTIYMSVIISVAALMIGVPSLYAAARTALACERIESVKIERTHPGLEPDETRS